MSCERAVVLVVGLAITLLIVLVISANATNWIALTHGYCQESRIGSQSTAWVKCK